MPKNKRESIKFVINFWITIFKDSQKNLVLAIGGYFALYKIKKKNYLHKKIYREFQRA